MVAARGRVGLFLLPAGGGLRLHDHPGMTVLLRVVLGRVRVQDLDWVDPRAGLARRGRDVVLGPGDGVLAAGPARGNLHALSALEPSAFVDVLTPGYDDARPCTYYALAGEVVRDGARLVVVRPA